MDRDELEAAIRSAFKDVRLGSGISIRQAQVIDDFGRGVTREEFKALPLSEVTDDWARVPEIELLRNCISHLDGEGLRYYLPAVMLRLLDHHDEDDRMSIDGADMTAIETISALAPDARFDETFEAAWFSRFDGFTAEQRAAIARNVEALPRLADLDDRDATTLPRSLDRHWARFLPPSLITSTIGRVSLGSGWPPYTRRTMAGKRSARTLIIVLVVGAIVLACSPAASTAPSAASPQLVTTAPSQASSAASSQLPAGAGIVLKRTGPIGCDAIGVDYKSATIKIDAASDPDVWAETDTGKKISVAWTDGFTVTDGSPPVINGPKGEEVARDGTRIDVPAAAYPRLAGYFVCLGPDAIYVLETDPQ